VATTIHDILDELDDSTDERDTGDKFERLMAAYLRTDVSWSDRFSDVWLWSEWPGRHGKPDTGIDLVAEERETGGLTAIQCAVQCAVQCKFYGPTHTLQKSDIDSFTASGKESFSGRMIVATTDRWSRSFLVANADYVAKATGSDAVGAFLVDTGGPSSGSVADRIRAAVGPEASVTDLSTTRHVVGSSLTAVGLAGLTRLELGFALVLAAVATGLVLVLVLGLAERRRTWPSRPRSGRGRGSWPRSSGARPPWSPSAGWPRAASPAGSSR
jgi:hypothetical protein